MNWDKTVIQFNGNQLGTGDSPYNKYFGLGVYDKAYLNRLEVKNGQSLDVIVCLSKYYVDKKDHSKWVYPSGWIIYNDKYSQRNILS